MFLDDDEIAGLTNVRCRQRLRRYELQRQALTQMGIEHRVRPDGSLVVSRAYVEGLLSGLAGAKVIKHNEPNWDAAP